MQQNVLNENRRNMFQTLSIELAQILAMSKSILRYGTSYAECNSWARWIWENISILILDLRKEKEERADSYDISSIQERILDKMVHIKKDADKLSGMNSLQEICMEYVHSIIDQIQKTQEYLQTCIFGICMESSLTLILWSKCI